MTDLPNDPRLERDVLGACLLRPDALPTIDLSDEDFSVRGHREVWRAMLRLQADGERVDLVRLRSALIDAGKLAEVGGEEGLTKLRYVMPPHELPVERLRKLTRLRGIRRAAEIVVARCADGDLDATVSALADAHGSALQGARKTRTQDVMSLCEGLLEELRGDKESVPRVHPGYEIMERRLGSIPIGCTVAVLASTNVGKSSLLLEMLVRASERNVTCGYLSVEDQEPVVRARIVGMMSDVSSRKILHQKVAVEDFTRIAHGFGRIDKVKDRLHISILQGGTEVDVCAAMSELAARGCKMIAVDYLQKISSSKDYKSRAHEVSSIATRITSHGQRLGVAAVLASQCTREKTRLNECPSKHDMKECVTGEQIVMDARTGELVQVRDLVLREDAAAYALGADWKTHRASIARAWSTGRKAVFRLRTKSGRVVRATANHPFRLLHGWTRLDELKLGERIAVPRLLPEPSDARDLIDDDELRLLGYLIADGHYGAGHSIQFVKSDHELHEDICRIIPRYDVTARRVPCQGSEQVVLRANQKGPCNRLAQRLRDLGIYGDVGSNKRAPAEVMRGTNRSLAVFLGALWACDGSVFRRKNGGWSLKFTNTAPRLLDQVQWILLRLGIVSIREKWTRHTKSKVDIASIVISEADAVIRFAEVVPVVGRKGALLRTAANELSDRGRNARIDRLPIEATDVVTRLCVGSGVPYRFMKRDLGYKPQRKEMSRADLAVVAKRFGDGALSQLAESDVLWDEVVSIEADGEEETFDLSVPGLNNFVINGVFAHNSGDLENMVDAIIGVWREFEDDFAPLWCRLLKAKWGGVGESWRLERSASGSRLNEVEDSDTESPPDAKGDWSHRRRK